MENKTAQHQRAKARPIRVKAADITGGYIPAREEAEIASLASSIARHGLLQPPVIRRAADEGRFALVCGVRRMAACRMLGMKAIDAMLIDGDDEEARACYLEEHFTRMEPGAMEDAELISMADTDKLIGRFALDRGLIKKRICLLSLPERIRRIVKSHALSLEQALPLLCIPQEGRQMEAAYMIAERALTAQQAGRLARMTDCSQTAVCGRRRAVRMALREADELVAKMRARGVSSSISVYTQDSGLCIQITLPRE